MLRQGRGWCRAFGLAVVMACWGGATARAQDKDRTDYKVTIYDDEFFRGKYQIVRRSTPDLEVVKFRHKSESLKWKLAPGRSAVLYAETNYRRPVLVLVGEGEIKDLGKMSPNALHAVVSVDFPACPKGGMPRGVSKDVPKEGTED